MANNVFTSRFTARQVETALERALTAVQSINGQSPGGGGDVVMEELKLEKGEPALLEAAETRYAVGLSGETAPEGPWTEAVPQAAAGECLWTRVTLRFNSGEPVEFFTVSRMAPKGGTVFTSVTLTAAGWTGQDQTVALPQAAEDAQITVAPAPDSGENYRLYGQCAVRCVSQGAGALTFRCDRVPAQDLTVNVRVEDALP